MEGRDAHPRDRRQLLDADRLAKAGAQAVHGGDHPLRRAVGQSHPGDIAAVGAGEQPVTDLAHDHRVKRPNRLWRIDQAHQAQRAVGQRALEISHENATAGFAARLRRRLQALRDAAHDGQIQLEGEHQAGLAGASLEHPAHGRGLDADHQRLASPVFKLAVAEHRPFRALRHDAQGRPGQHVPGRFRLVGPHDDQAVDGRCEWALPRLSIGVAHKRLRQRVCHTGFSSEAKLIAISRNRQE